MNIAAVALIGTSKMVMVGALAVTGTNPYQKVIDFDLYPMRVKWEIST